METRRVETQCCIAGGGPAGIMLGYLLARGGIQVTILEKWPDFFRDFRGDTIHPSTMQALKELGLLDEFLKLPHNETRQVALHIGGEKAILADFTHLRQGCPFIGFVPQWDFLTFIAEKGRQHDEFDLRMETEASELIFENEKVVGLRAKDKEGFLEIKAPLVIGADGRHSTVRGQSHLPKKNLTVPIDVLWFRLPRIPSGADESLGYVDGGKFMVLINRDSYWQCGYLIKKDGFEALKEKGLDSFKKDIAMLAPFLTSAVSEIKDWDDVKFLSVTVDRLSTWYKPGLLLIGDAAHAMSPVGGVGINLAIQDAIATANILIPAFRRPGGVTLSDLHKVQKRRMFPTKVIQKFQTLIHKKILVPVLKSRGRKALPWQFRIFSWLPILRRIPAYIIGIGPRPEHVLFEKK